MKSTFYLLFYRKNSLGSCSKKKCLTVTVRALLVKIRSYYFCSSSESSSVFSSPDSSVISSASDIASVATADASTCSAVASVSALGDSSETTVASSTVLGASAFLVAALPARRVFFFLVSLIEMIDDYDDLTWPGLT